LASRAVVGGHIAAYGMELRKVSRKMPRRVYNHRLVTNSPAPRNDMSHVLRWPGSDQESGVLYSLFGRHTGVPHGSLAFRCGRAEQPPSRHIGVPVLLPIFFSSFAACHLFGPQSVG
jgi:hypothetical protein